MIVIEMAEARRIALRHVCYLAEEVANPKLIHGVRYKARWFNLRVSVNAGFE